MPRQLDFFFSIASTYTYLAVNRAEEPTFACGTELFWGDDRIEDAVEWCKTQHP